MIQLVQKQNQDDFFLALRHGEASSCRIETLYRQHGDCSPYAEFWVIYDGDKQPVGAISRYAGALTLCAGGGMDTGELRDFLQMIGCELLETDYPDVKRLLAGFDTIALHNLLSYRSSDPNCDTEEVNRSPRLSEVYRLLCKTDAEFKENSDFDHWLWDLSSRQRKGLCRIFSIESEEHPISTGGIYTMSERCAMISSVATDPGKQKRGHASKIVRSLCHEALALGKTPLLICTDELLPYYSKMGFAKQKNWYTLERLK